MTVSIFGKFRTFVREMLLESKVLLSSNIFHTNFLILFRLEVQEEVDNDLGQFVLS